MTVYHSYNPIGKTLAQVAKETEADFKGGYSVFVLENENDYIGKEIDMSYSVKRLLEIHPELAKCRVKYENDFFGTTVLRVGNVVINTEKNN